MTVQKTPVLNGIVISFSSAYSKDNINGIKRELKNRQGSYKSSFFNFLLWFLHFWVFKYI